MDTKILGKPYTVERAAGYTGFTVSYLYKLAHQKKIPFYKPEGGKILFSEDDLNAFVYRNRQSAGYEVQEQADAILTGRA